MTLFMTDWGGPLGLDFARKQPARVKRIVISNTWCWPVADDFHFKSFSYLMSSWFAQYLIKHTQRLRAAGDARRRSATGVSSRPRSWPTTATRSPSPKARAANAALPGYIVGATDWLASIWREARGLH